MSKNTGKRAALAAETAHERFLRMAKPGNPDECWEWPGNRIAAGYGTFGHHYRPHYVHRTSYEVHKGPIPDGLHICHHCDNPPCWNPAHLFAGTPADNAADMVRKGRARRGDVKGSDHPLAKLTEEAVRYIRNSTERGVDLARRFGVYPTLITRVRQGKCWPHVT